MLFTFFPIPLINVSILAFVAYFAIEVVILEVSSIHIPTLVQCPFPIFLIVQKLPHIPRPVRVSSLARAIRDIVFPLSLVPEPLFANIDPISVCNIVFEVSIIVASVSLNESSFALAPSMDKNSFQHIIILEVELAVPMGFLVNNLAYILGIQPWNLHFLLRHHEIPEPGSLGGWQVLIGILDKLTFNAMILIAGNLMQS